MSGFDSVIVVDWSAAAVPAPVNPAPNAIWIGIAEDEAVTTHYQRTRHDAMAFLEVEIARRLDTGRRVLAGFDFPFGYPAGTALRFAGTDDPFALWKFLADRIEDAPDNANNRFKVANELNAKLPGTGPFWGRPAHHDLADLPTHGLAREGHGMVERRACELIVPSAQTLWQLYGNGAVGSQTLVGIPRLNALRARFADVCAVWPFQPPDSRLVLAEVYPSLLAAEVGEATGPGYITDEVQVRLLSRALARMDAEGTLTDAFAAAEGPRSAEEGWILGVGAEALLRAAAAPTPKSTEPLRPPRLKDDCFALPAGVDWTPVDQALARLRDRLHPVVPVETVPLDRAGGKVLAKDATARRGNPPAANSAVDGYGFAHDATGEGDQLLPLVAGRAAAGAPLDGAVPRGQAVRILTGALLPKGVDTVVLDEDCSTDGARVAFETPVKKGANTRKAGEDVAAGAPALAAGTRLGAAEIALLAATGITEVSVFLPLRVGVLSTGDEVVPPGVTDDPARTYDANRPMLLELLRDWRMEAVDLGHVGDDRANLRSRLDEAVASCDAILTSGGASAGDEDHVSALLGETGTRADWRIALKPGRPLALGVWQGVPVFGLPGNPVAALVCTMIFARPAFAVLGGEGWRLPTGFNVPAAFSKSKKAGRREYLRARMNADGCAEVFRSEGSGRISGLAWADGLVEIGDGAGQISPGDPVRYLPFTSFR